MPAIDVRTASEHDGKALSAIDSGYGYYQLDAAGTHRLTREAGHAWWDTASPLTSTATPPGRLIGVLDGAGFLSGAAQLLHHRVGVLGPEDR